LLYSWILNYDFIGAPWIKCSDVPYLSESGVGNVGFSLRIVKSFLKLLTFRVPWHNLDEEIKSSEGSGVMNRIYYVRKVSQNIIPVRNNIQRHIEKYIRKSRHEDRFLYYYTQKYNPRSSIAPIEVALRFAFEAIPRIC
jgi:hypothetical protein